MRQKIIGQQQLILEKNNRGFVSIILLIIISSLVTVLLIGGARISIATLESRSVLSNGLNAEIFAEGCADESILQLKRNENYLGQTITVGDASCIITVTTQNGNKNISINANVNNANKLLLIEVIYDPFEIISWDI